MYTETNRILTATRLRKLREDKNLSPAELAKAMKEQYGDTVKISKETIIKIETADPKSYKFTSTFGLRIDTLCYLADFFETTVDYLIGITGYKERKTLGLSEETISHLTGPPLNFVLKTFDDPVIETTKKRRTTVNGKHGVLVEDHETKLDTVKLYQEIDRIPRIYLKALNDIMENVPSIFSEICTILYSDPELSRSDPINEITVDGYTFGIGHPGGRNSINAHMDCLCDLLIALRNELQKGDKQNG